MHRFVASLVLLALAASPAFAPAVAQDAGGLEGSKDYKDTQEFIKRTQTKIDQVRRETDARAKEIEAIANRVGEVISTMSSQGEDNSSLRSEMEKLAGLLEIERETARGLKAELAGWNRREKDLETKLQAAEESSRANEKRLGAALESIAGHARTNRQLVSDIESLQKEVEQLRKENDMLRRLRSSNPSLPLQR